MRDDLKKTEKVIFPGIVNLIIHVCSSVTKIYYIQHFEAVTLLVSTYTFVIYFVYFPEV